MSPLSTRHAEADLFGNALILEANADLQESHGIGRADNLATTTAW
jgi:hypothetical protein